MKLKDRIKSYSFWVSLASAIFLILQTAGQKFGFNVDEGLFNDLFTSLCSILVILGIIVPPSSKDKSKVNDEPANNVKVIIDENTLGEETKNYTELEKDTQNEDFSNDKSDIELLENDNKLMIENNSEKKSDIENLETIENNLFECETAVESLENNIEPEQINYQIENLNNEEELKNLLNLELSKFEGNYSNYINLLQEQIDNLSNK